MPKMSDTMEEGVIASWLKKVGDEIKSGDILAEVETDKATMELESYDDGTLLHIGVKDGDSVPVDGVIAIIGEKGEDVNEILKDVDSDSSEVEEIKEIKEESTPIEKVEEIKDDNKEIVITEPTKIVSELKDERVKASPLAKKLANEKGIDISNISGSGDGGRIIRKDIENYKDVSTSSNEPVKEITLPKICLLYTSDAADE